MRSRKVINPTLAFYNEKADLWATRHTDSFWHEEQFRKFVTHLKKKAKVIDIGCAHGIHVPLFLGIGRELKYIGIDASDSMIQLARSRYPQLRFVKENIVDLADEEGLVGIQKFEGFWAGAVLMHIPRPDWDYMLENIERITTRSATGYITLPVERPSKNGNDQRHFTFFSPGEFERIIQKRGWAILDHGKFEEKPIWQWYLVRLP